MFVCRLVVMDELVARTGTQHQGRGRGMGFCLIEKRRDGDENNLKKKKRCEWGVDRREHYGDG
jgi:hypothetical protein